MKEVIIVGGGIAGLAAAFYLQRKAGERGKPVSYRLLEQSERLGGKIITRRENGLIIEGGPDSFINQKPQGLQLCRDLGLTSELLPSNDELYRTRLLRKGRLIPFPKGFRLAVPTKILPFALSPLISPWGKLRMGMDLFIPARKDTSDESLAQFITRRLGREALERIAGPIMSGIYVGDPQRMSVQTTFPMFVQLERKYGSLTMGIRKARAARKKAGVIEGSIFSSLRDGMESLVSSLTGKLNGEVRVNTTVSRLEYGNDRFKVHLEGAAPLECDAVILAVPAYRAADLTADLNPELAKGLRRIRYVSSATVSLLYRDEDIANCPDGGHFGFVVPRDETANLLAFTWSSRKFNGRAPVGSHLVRAFVGGSRREELALLPAGEQIRLVREDLARLLKIEAEPQKVWTYSWPQGNPQFDVGHQDMVSGLETLAERHPGLHLIGSAYRGVGIPDCTKGAIAAVERICE